MLNQQQPKGRWVYSYTLSRHIFIDEKRRVIDPNVALLKSNVVPQPFVADPALQFVQQTTMPFVADPTLQFVQQTAEAVKANTYICNDVAKNVVGTKQSEPEVIWTAPYQPVEEKNSTMVPDLPNPQPAPRVNFTSNDAGLKEKETTRVPLHAPRVKPAMTPVTNRNMPMQVQKSPQREVKEVATANHAPATGKLSTPKAKTTVKVDNKGADNPPKNQSTKSKNEWSTVKSRKKFTPREDRDSSPSKNSTSNGSRKGGYRNRRYMSRSKLLGRNWRDVQEAAHRRAAAPTPPAQRRTAAPTPTRNVRNRTAPTPSRNARNYAAPRAAAPTSTRRAPRRQYTVPANATKLEPPITLDKLQGKWINSRNEEVTVRGQNYTFSKYGGVMNSGYFQETDEEFLVNGWILQKSGNVVLWYKPYKENITWRRIGGDATRGSRRSTTPLNSAASEARDYASTRPCCEVVHLTCRTDLRSGCNMASRKVKNFEKDEPLVVDTSTLCTLGANDNNIVRIRVVFPCKGWISKFQKNGSPTYKRK